MSTDDIQPPSPDRPRRGNVTAAQPTRGRPADPEVAEIEFTDEETGAPLTRRSRHDGLRGTYDVPEHLKKSGWDYQWNGDRVMNQPVAATEKIANREAGWRPVKAEGDWLQICAPGHAKPYVERDGMVLETRPMYLTEQARAEDYEIAQTVKSNRLEASAIGAQISRDHRMPAGVTKSGFTIEGEIGHHRQPSAAERAGARR